MNITDRGQTYKHHTNDKKRGVNIHMFTSRNINVRYNTVYS